jgi:(E)-4-hydroxy-3-methylbut-2-enyl-diphosphate synthase
VGGVAIGGGAPVCVQSMTKTPTDDARETLRQIRELAALGCAIVRTAVPTVRELDAFGEIVRESPIPVVADIHFDWRVALGAIRAGAHKVRINPGNMTGADDIARLADAAGAAGIPIRIGVNSGSVRHKQEGPDARDLGHALAEEALGYAEEFERRGFRDLVLSLKAATARETIRANRLAAAACDIPLHLGVTAAGPPAEALLKSAVGIGALLVDGIGDTVRLSFTGDPGPEVTAGIRLLRAAGLREDGPTLHSCPTCGRCSVDLTALVGEVEAALAGISAPLSVAVMGCEVNGPGEAREADVGIAAAGGRFTLFRKGESVRTLRPDEAVAALLAEVRTLLAEKDA